MNPQSTDLLGNSKVFNKSISRPYYRNSLILFASSDFNSFNENPKNYDNKFNLKNQFN